MSVRTQLTRSVSLPDKVKLERYARAPELGPRILFFSGGSALRQTCRVLKRYTHNSIHLITPFDSGGSSAEFRRAFGMLSIGDLRNRIIALADESAMGNPEIYELFSYRLGKAESQAELKKKLESMVDAEHPLVREVPSPMRRLVRTYLGLFLKQIPEDFDLRGASIGNLILAGGYLQNERDIDSVVFLFSKLVAARGSVFPTVDADLHLRARLSDGTWINGQHNITGKETAPLDKAVCDLKLIRGLSSTEAVSVSIPDKIKDLIENADLIVFPIGSFYSSVICNLLPKGVGHAIAKAPCPKVYVPSLGLDPEVLDTPVDKLSAEIVEHIRRDAGPVDIQKILNLVLLDKEHERYAGHVNKKALEAQELQVAEVEMGDSSGLANPTILAELLLSMA